MKRERREAAEQWMDRADNHYESLDGLCELLREREKAAQVRVLERMGFEVRPEAGNLYARSIEPGTLGIYAPDLDALLDEEA